MHLPRLSCWRCKFYLCYWIHFHQILRVVIVVFISSLATPWVIVMTASGAVRDAVFFVDLKIECYSQQINHRWGWGGGRGGHGGWCVWVCVCVGLSLYPCTWFPEHSSRLLWDFNFKFHVHVVCGYWFSVMPPSKWLAVGHIGFFGFQTVTLVWLWISSSNFTAHHMCVWE